MMLPQGGSSASLDIGGERAAAAEAGQSQGGGGSMLQNFPGMHFVPRALARGRRDSTAQESEISVASDEDAEAQGGAVTA